MISKRKIARRTKYLQKHSHDAEDTEAELQRMKELYPDDFQNLNTETEI